MQENVEVGFFTDPTVCIGCKACEVACKEWNEVPDDGFTWSGNSYDNTGHLGASTWRHVLFLEQDQQKGNQVVGSHSLGNNDGGDPFAGSFCPMFASIARKPAASKHVQPAQSYAPRSVRFLCKTTCATAADIASSRVRSVLSIGGRRRRRLQVHILLRSTKKRARARLCEGLPD